MTDFTDDELVSAVLDGEATDEEAARVRADPALSARLGELQSARDAIAASVTLPRSEQRDALIAIAVTSADPTAATRPSDQLRERRRRRALRIASIAAAVLAVAGLVGAIAALSARDSGKTSSTAAGQAPSSAATAPAAAPESTSPSPEAPRAAAAQADGLAELGSFQTAQELADAVKARITSAPQALFATSGAAADSSSASAPCGPRTDVTYVARASLSGQPVTVMVSGRAGQQTIEVDDINCAVVFTRPL